MEEGNRNNWREKCENHNLKKGKFVLKPCLYANTKEDEHPDDVFIQHAYYPKDFNEYLEHLAELIKRANDLIKSLKAIVICSSNLHAIRVGCVILHSTKTILEAFLNKAFDMHGQLCLETDIEVICDLINHATTGLRVYESMDLAHTAINQESDKLKKFRDYVSDLQATVSFLVHTKLFTSVSSFLKANVNMLNPKLMSHFKCRRCSSVVTFSGCFCTNWKRATEEIPEYLLSYDTNAPDSDMPVVWPLQLKYLKEILNNAQKKVTGESGDTAVCEPSTSGIQKNISTAVSEPSTSGIQKNISTGAIKKTRHVTIVTDVSKFPKIKPMETHEHTPKKRCQEYSRSREIAEACDELLRRPNYPTSMCDFVNIVLNSAYQAEDIARAIEPIVIATPYQNAIRTAYIVAKESENYLKRLLDIFFEIGYAVVFDCLTLVACHLFALINGGLKVYESVQYIQNKTNSMNNSLRNFGDYIYNLQVIICYLLNDIQHVDVVSFAEESSDFVNEIQIYRFDCKICRKLVTFNGCCCTNWEDYPFVTNDINKVLLSSYEDGPSTSEIEPVYNWETTMKNLENADLHNRVVKERFSSLSSECLSFFTQYTRKICRLPPKLDPRLESNSIDYWISNKITSMDIDKELESLSQKSSRLSINDETSYTDSFTTDTCDDF